MNRIATIGFFDGVHKGHQFLFERLRVEADKRGLSPLIITFDTHPRAVLQKNYVPALVTTRSERQALLEDYAEVLMVPFERVQNFTAAQFMQRLHDKYEVTVLLMGYDHRFGSDRLRDLAEYRRIGAEIGVEVLKLPEFTVDKMHISSTQIRESLLHGDVQSVQQMLGRPYSIRGMVVHGKALGRTIGYPTANIQPSDPYQIIPRPGVYVAKILLPMYNPRQALVNIDRQSVIEAYLPGFSGSLYEQKVILRFERFLREERHFKNMEDLRVQIKADVDSILRPDE